MLSLLVSLLIIEADQPSYELENSIFAGTYTRFDYKCNKPSQDNRILIRTRRIGESAMKT